MSRPVTEAMGVALANGYPRGIFVSIEHPDGTAYFCSGIRSRSWNGHTWTAVGKTGRVTPIRQTSAIAVQDIAFQLSGVDADIVADLSDNVRNLNGSVWIYCVNPDDTIVRDPYQIIDSELDYQNFKIEDDGTATIEIVAHAGFYTLDRGVEEAWTSENQALTYPLDTGLDMVATLQKQDLKWTPV